MKTEGETFGHKVSPSGSPFQNLFPIPQGFALREK